MSRIYFTTTFRFSSFRRDCQVLLWCRVVELTVNTHRPLLHSVALDRNTLDCEKYSTHTLTTARNGATWYLTKWLVKRSQWHEINVFNLNINFGFRLWLHGIYALQWSTQENIKYSGIQSVFSKRRKLIKYNIKI